MLCLLLCRGTSLGRYQEDVPVGRMAAMMRMAKAPDRPSDGDMVTIGEGGGGGGDGGCS